jgi:hypothetical protein
MNDMMTDGKFYCLLGCGARVSEPMACDVCFKASNPQLTNERREKSKADARALWAYRAQELSLLYSAEMTDLEAHERKLVEHFRDLKLPESIRRELGECPA